ncbi:HAMP domain-containing histidine kinase [Chitinophaga varians]|uniref:histidine kinase n=1 Tax=Chitinophaga varians TaxID=2202339 RepID=A0A847RJY6_9BACT|nr:HAMP domain-containing sensor histidine kinase [Chitinophaga varians]NLR67329.1 HAMP domain-containing histidine kinase [Chitinophaga varians]
MNQTFPLLPAEHKDRMQNDETHQREIESLNKTNQYLQIELRKMKDFMKAVNHDLGAPLNGIEYLLDNFSLPAFTENWVEYYQMLQLVCIAIKDLRENTFHFLNTGDNSPVIQEVDPITLMESVILFLKPAALARDIVLKLSISDKTPDKITSDPTRLNRIVTNLTSNAIKFSHRGTTVLLSATENDGNCVLSVKDEGIGIPEDKLQTIFEAGVRLDKDAPGLGVGLHISRTFAEQLTGTLTVKSQLNCGSTFTLTLPKEYAAQH